MSALIGEPWRVIAHEVIREGDYATGSSKFYYVRLHRIGHPSKEAHGVEWEQVFRVPEADLAQWKLGSTVRIIVQGQGAL